MVPESYKTKEPEWNGKERREMPESTHIDPKELGMLIQSVQSLEKLMNYKFDELSNTIKESNNRHSSTADGLKLLITENYNHFEKKINELERGQDDNTSRIRSIEIQHNNELLEQKKKEGTIGAHAKKALVTALVTIGTGGALATITKLVLLP